MTTSHVSVVKAAISLRPEPINQDRICSSKPRGRCWSTCNKKAAYRRAHIRRLGTSGIMAGSCRRLAMVLSQTFQAQSGDVMYLYQRLFARSDGASGAESVASIRISGRTEGTLPGFSLVGNKAYQRSLERRAR